MTIWSLKNVLINLRSIYKTLVGINDKYQHASSELNEATDKLMRKPATNYYQQAKQPPNQLRFQKQPIP